MVERGMTLPKTMTEFNPPFSIQQALNSWLSRNVGPRGSSVISEIGGVLSTDVGAVRNENQDRVAALRYFDGRGGLRNIIAVVVADGMGGMSNGGGCASLAVATFFEALLFSGLSNLETRALQAIDYANGSVHAFSEGRGGTTFSAVLIDGRSPPLSVHVGDSRIYSSTRGKIERLTIDDSLLEVVGGHGTQLIQYVGMGEGLRPHIKRLPNDLSEIIITTDGIHYVNAETLQSIMSNSTTPRIVADRLSALARWCGSPDNASLAVFSLAQCQSSLQAPSVANVQMWDSFSSMMLFSPSDLNRPHQQRPASTADAPPSVRQDAASPIEKNQPKKAATRSRKSKKKSSVDSEIQLEIEIGQVGDSSLKNENK